MNPSRGIEARNQLTEPPVDQDEPLQFSDETHELQFGLGKRVLEQVVKDPDELKKWLAAWRICRLNPAGLSLDEITDIDYGLAQLDVLIGEVKYSLSLQPRGAAHHVKIAENLDDVDLVIRAYALITGEKVRWNELNDHQQAELKRIASRHQYSLDTILTAARQLQVTIEEFCSLVALGQIKKRVVEHQPCYLIKFQ